MKAETLRKYYRGPTYVRNGLMLTFQWTSRARGWPRQTYRLWFNPYQRLYWAELQTHHSVRNRGPFEQLDATVIATLRSLLTPEQVAICTAESIDATASGLAVVSHSSSPSQLAAGIISVSIGTP